MTAFGTAFARASRGLDWSYPCLIWLADYLRDATGNDPAADWRSVNWTERKARRELGSLARRGEGDTLLERALDVIAQRNGWCFAAETKQGAVMVGLFTDGAGVGIPAIFDGRDRWLVAALGNATTTKNTPIRMWEVPNEDDGALPGHLAGSVGHGSGPR